MCSPTLTDVTRAWGILEYYRKTWLEPCWLGCSLERYEEIKSHDDFMAWMEEKPEHANSDLAFYWKAGVDYGLGQYGGGCGRYITWGYLPHEDKYQYPTIDSRNDAVIMKSGIYDSTSDSFTTMDQSRLRENTTHAWYEEGEGDVHPYDRTTHAIQKNAPDFDGNYSWSTDVSDLEHGRCEAGPFARQVVAGGTHGHSWQHHDPFILSMFKALGGPSLHLRQIARMHETIKLYRQAERCLREFRLDEPFYVKPKQKDGRGWGATEAIRGALAHWVELEDGKIKNYQIVAPTTWNVGPRDSKGNRGPIEEALIGTPIALATGECLTAPDVQLPRYPVKVENGRVFVQVTK